VAWFPLGYGEIWVPGFKASPQYIERVNLRNTVIADRGLLAKPNPAAMHYLYRDRAMTAVSEEQFTRGSHIGSGYVRVPREAVTHAEARSNPAVERPREAGQEFAGNRGLGRPGEQETARGAGAHESRESHPQSATGLLHNFAQGASSAAHWVTSTTEHFLKGTGTKQTGAKQGQRPAPVKEKKPLDENP
jgi:hypothetical protein